MDEKEYIERDQAVRKALDACIKVVGHGISQVNAVDIADEIDSIPAADVVEVRHGEWIPTYHTYYNRDGACQIADEWHCSECGVYSRDNQKYCTNCGAKMDGKGEGDVA